MSPRALPSHLVDYAHPFRPAIGPQRRPSRSARASSGAALGSPLRGPSRRAAPRGARILGAARLLCLAGAVVSLAPARAQGQVAEDWNRTVTLLGSNIYGTMVAADAQDSLYATGYYSYYRIVTAKFAPNGTPLWQVEFNNPGTRDHAAWLTVDPFGDVLVAGLSVVGASSLTPNGHVLLKYDPAGNLLWSHVDPGTLWSLSRVATDGNGDVLVVGQAPSGVVKKYSRAGALLWTRPVQATLNALAIDPNGTVFVAGNQATNLVTSAFDALGTPLWSRTTPSATGATDLALGPAGAVYVGGAALGTSPNRTLIAKFDAGGQPLWTNTYAGNQARRIGVDRRGDVVFTSAHNPNGGYVDWLTQKVDPAGTVQWSAIFNQHAFNDEHPYALTLGADDEIYITGQGGPGPTSGNVSYTRTVTVRYSRTGVQEWVGSTFGSSRGRSVAHLSDNSIAAVGESPFTVFHYRQSAVWRSLGNALAGTVGLPRLEGTASPRSAMPVTLELGNAAPNALEWTVAGLSRTNQPLFGGVLVPQPDVLFGAHVVSPAGQMSLPLTWPAGMPPGFEITFQSVILDSAAPQGFAASNALVGISE